VLAASPTKEALPRNLDIAGKLGCLDADGLAEMRRGKAPTVRRGPYRGQELSVDHIIPRSVCPELDNVIANLELLPLGVNERKDAKPLTRHATAWHGRLRMVENSPRSTSAGGRLARSV